MFKRRAEELHRNLNVLLSDVHANLELQLVINGDGPPRRGSFEVSIAKTPTSERSLLWTGLKNSPRAAKFPVVERIADDIKQYLGITSAESEATKKITTQTSLESKEFDESTPKSSKVAAAVTQKPKRGRRKT